MCLEGVNEPVGTGNHLAAQNRVAETLAGGLEGRLVKRASGEPEVVGPSLAGCGLQVRRCRVHLLGADVREGVAEQPVESHRVAGFEKGEPRKLKAH